MQPAYKRQLGTAAASADCSEAKDNIKIKYQINKYY